MAKIEFKGIDRYAEQLNRLGVRAEGVVKYAVFEGAAIVADAIKANTPVDTGDLKNSMALTPMQNKNGYVYTTVVFEGYDRKGAANAVKAAVLEHGSSTRLKHPFIRPAINRVRAEAEAAMEAALTKKLEEYFED